MKLLCQFASLLLLLCSTSQAQLVIYKANVKKQGLQQGSLYFTEAYQIIDLATNQSKAIDLYNSQSKKNRTYIVEDILNYHARTYEQGAKTFTLFVYDNSVTEFGSSTSDFQLAHFTLLGVNAQLPVGGEASKATFPKLFTARFTYATSDVFANLTGLYTYQAKLTQRENDAVHTIDEAVAAIVVDLEKKGFTNQATN